MESSSSSITPATTVNPTLPLTPSKPLPPPKMAFPRLPLLLPVAVVAVVLPLLLHPSSGQHHRSHSLSSRDDLAALYALRKSLTLRARDWPRKSDPCSSWLGVGCNHSGRVVSVDLSHLRRNRFGRDNPLLALGPLSNLTSLQSFSSSGFPLWGSIPNALASSLPSSLSHLDLSLSNISGLFPSPFFSLPNLLFLNLSHNRLHGPLPSSPLYLPQTLDLSSNFLLGDPPPSLDRTFFLSANCFKANSQRSLRDCSTFYSTNGLTFHGSDRTTAMTSKRKHLYISVGVSAAAVVSILAVSAVFLRVRRTSRRRRRRPTTNRQREGGGSSSSSSSSSSSYFSAAAAAAVGDSFTYEKLLQATMDFGEANLVKRGHSGDLFFGNLESGASVVVKRIGDEESLKVELDFFSHASHTRLVPVLGHCLEKDKGKLIVYKYMPNRDLSNALHKKSSRGDDSPKSLDWITRLKIATGVAEALCYLHHEHVPALVHRDIQASSILLDDKFEVRLGSLSSVCPQGDSYHNVITRFLRSSQSAETSTSGSASATCTYDVYCLGKVLLELVTGKLGISGWNDANTNEWLDQTLPYIHLYDKEPVMKIVDPSLILDEDFMEEVWAVAIVAKSCLNPRPTRRPLMKYILKALENPLRVVRDENLSHSARLRITSSRSSWNAAIFGSWRSSSDVTSVSALPREAPNFRRNGAIDSQSGREQSFGIWRPSNEIFPEPARTLSEEA